MRINLITSISSGQFAGVEKYTMNLLRYFSTIETKNIYRLVNFPPSVASFFPFDNILVSYSLKDILKSLFSGRMPGLIGSSFVYFKKVGINKNVRNMIYGYLRQQGFSFQPSDMGSSDIVHALTHFVPYFIRASHVVATVHDLGPLRMPHLYPKTTVNYYRFEFPWQLERCDKVIVDTPATLEDVHEFYGISRDRLVVIPLGVDASFKRTEHSVVLKKHDIAKPYIFYPIGTIEPRKNIEAAIEAVREVRKELGSSHVLVLMGRSLVQYDTVERAIEKGVAEEIVHNLGYVPQNDVAALYSGADLVIYPSLYEGFGLPILESMACGTATAVSSIKAHEFVGGDATFFFKDKSASSIAEGIIHLITNEKLRLHHVELGLKRARSFGWDHTAKRTLDLYETLS